MRWQKNGPFYQLRLERGEEILTTLTEFVHCRRLKSGVLFGLGAAENLRLGYYNLKQKRYLLRRFQGEYELGSLVGNIAWVEREPVIHIHAVISNQRLTTYSGHLFAATVAATCEIAIITGGKKVQRRLEPVSGLKLLAL